MADLTLPVLRFRSSADRERAAQLLEGQRFDTRQESGSELSFTPWTDLDEAHELLRSEGIACERASRTVARLGPPRPAEA